MLRCKLINDEYTIVELESKPKESILKEWLGSEVPQPTPLGYQGAQ
jgi:hypothetical protein